MTDEVNLLSQDSKVLLCQVLEMKANLSQTQRRVTSMGIKLARAATHVSMEVTNLHHVTHREGRDYSNIQLHVRFFPDEFVEGETSRTTQVFKNQPTSIIFDLLEPPVELTFDFALKQEECALRVGFIIIDVCQMSFMSILSQIMGQVVVQVTASYQLSVIKCLALLELCFHPDSCRFA